MSLLKVAEAAQVLCCAPASLYSRVFRTKLRLPAVKIGNSLRFDSRDVERVVEKGRENLIPMPQEEVEEESTDAAD